MEKFLDINIENQGKRNSNNYFIFIDGISRFLNFISFFLYSTENKMKTHSHFPEELLRMISTRVKWRATRS